MKDLIHAFPDNIKEAIEIAEASELKKPSNNINNIVQNNEKANQVNL